MNGRKRICFIRWVILSFIFPFIFRPFIFIFVQFRIREFISLFLCILLGGFYETFNESA